MNDVLRFLLRDFAAADSEFLKDRKWDTARGFSLRALRPDASKSRRQQHDEGYLEWRLHAISIQLIEVEIALIKCGAAW